MDILEACVVFVYIFVSIRLYKIRIPLSIKWVLTSLPELIDCTCVEKAVFGLFTFLLVFDFAKWNAAYKKSMQDDTNTLSGLTDLIKCYKPAPAFGKFVVSCWLFQCCKNSVFKHRIGVGSRPPQTARSNGYSMFG